MPENREPPPLPRPSLKDSMEEDAEEDYTTPSEAQGRTFYINLGLIRFGTKDPVQGAFPRWELPKYK